MGPNKLELHNEIKRRATWQQGEKLFDLRVDQPCTCIGFTWKLEDGYRYTFLYEEAVALVPGAAKGKEWVDLPKEEDMLRMN